MREGCKRLGWVSEVCDYRSAAHAVRATMQSPTRTHIGMHARTRTRTRTLSHMRMPAHHRACVYVCVCVCVGAGLLVFKS